MLFGENLDSLLPQLLAAWVWDFSPTIFSLLGREVRWYGLLFATGFFLANHMMHHMYKKEGRDRSVLDKLPLYMIPATVIGARMGHVLFYDPGYYFSHPWKILYIWEGGLASHGAAVGLLLVLIGYCTRYKVPYLMVLDKLIIAVALTGACVRLGNWANSEIYGIPTGSRQGVIFVSKGVSRYLENGLGSSVEIRHAGVLASVDEDFTLEPLEMRLKYRGDIDSSRLTRALHERLARIFSKDYLREHLRLRDQAPNYIQTQRKAKYINVDVQLWGVARHPTQLYEALFYFLLFLATFLWWDRQRKRPLPYGVMFTCSFIVLWVFRWGIEFLKERQDGFAHHFLLNTGQMLSLPFIVGGVILLWYIYRPKSGYNLKKG